MYIISMYIILTIYIYIVFSNVTPIVHAQRSVTSHFLNSSTAASIIKHEIIISNQYTFVK